VLLNVVEGERPDIAEYRKTTYRTMEQLLNVQQVANARVGVAVLPLIPKYPSANPPPSSSTPPK
jgi:hypothetical protein